MTHDVAAISLSMYLGESAGAIVGVIYLWITVGNGFRYGVKYLYSCAALCIAGFALVYVNSPYWQSNGLLSLYVLLTLVIVPPYVGSLLRSLNTANEQLEHRAQTDSLTGLYRRGEIELKVQQLFKDGGTGHVLLFCDLDRFKEVNDAAGHAAGDKLLIDIASTIRNNIRASDVPCRLGGDEFCVLLYRCSLEKGREIAEELRSKVSGYRLAWGTNYYSVGISIGLASTDAAKDADSLFRLADAACYEAKNAGRNRVHVVDHGKDLISTAAIRLKGNENSV